MPASPSSMRPSLPLVNTAWSCSAVLAFVAWTVVPHHGKGPALPAPV